MTSPLITFHEARQIVALRNSGRPLPSGGTPYVSPDGFETVESDGSSGGWWVVTAGAVEWLVGGDRDFAGWDAPALYVSKRTGEVVERWHAADPDVVRPDLVRPVSDPVPL